MEEFYLKIDKIICKLNEIGCDDLSDLINEKIIEGVTIGEKFIGVVFELINIKKSNNKIYSLIKNEIDEIIKHSKKLNYI